jgi:hypothetical protein
MKKIFLCMLLFTAALLQAQSTDKVWNLLLTNKRSEARVLFDKTFKGKTNSSVELLVLDAMIKQEQGQIYFDETFLKQFIALKDHEHYLYPVWYQAFAMGNPNISGYDDLVFKKIDYLAGLPQFANNQFVIYNKAVYDRKRFNYAGYSENINKLGSIQNWQYCGVFENLNGSGMNTDYEPETYAKNDKTFNANSNGIINWYVPAIKQNEGFHFYINEEEYGNGVIYAQTFIESDADREVLLNFGASGPLKIFVNDVEAYSNDLIKRTDLNAYLIKFNLKKGINRLLLKSSTTGNHDYFFASVKDLEGRPLPQLVYYDSYRPYVKVQASDVNATEVTPQFEQYLIDKISQNPENPFYRILLFDAYTNNHKTEQAYEVLESLSAKYPQSSMLNVRLINMYNTEGETERADELAKNIMVNDESYYYTLASKFQDGDWLESASMQELEKYHSRAEKLISPHFALLYEYFIASRKQDIDMLLKKADEIIAVSHNNDRFINSFSQLHTSLKGNKDKTIAILKDLTSRIENFGAENALISYYHNSGSKEDARKLINKRIENYPYFNDMYADAIAVANGANNYEEALKYIEIGLKNFPYSFQLLEKKGVSFNALKNSKDAEKYYRESLRYHSSNSTLRKALYDLTKTPDEIEQVATKDVYSLIKQRRNSKMPTDNGVNILLDEYIVNILPEGSRKTKVTYIYEVVAENGIENLKEYSLGESNFTIIKAEIVKPDGTIVPAETNYDELVFTNLKVNDVVLVQYEKINNSYGRFYKDFTIAYTFNGVYPSRQTVLGIIHPADVTFAYDVTNGAIPAKTKKLNDRTYVSWERKDVQALPLEEQYSPAFTDVANQIRISSIKNWSDISNWYADLVKKNMKTDNVVLKAYNQIFPQGTAGLSQNEIAYRIYKYIEENITYSSLDFRQSGYVPQKPSKTITTRLGDCKDLSTLFVTLAERAGLKANLVLVSTNDNGVKVLKLPSIDFNHCIVKVQLDAKDHYLEMTNNYLPFKAMPFSLYNAKALVISFDKAENEKAGIINLNFNNALPNTITNKTAVTIDENAKSFTVTQKFTGSIKSYYNELFSGDTTDEVRKKEFEENLNSKLNKTISFGSAKLLENERFGESIAFETKFSISEKVQSVGSLKICQVPYIDKIYTRDIIAGEKRNFDINYTSYENCKLYSTEVVLNIAEGKKFVEVPADAELNYKGHKYSLKFTLAAPNTLKVVRTATVAWDDITAAEYPEFKKFVEAVIAAEEQVAGFK